MTQTASLRQGLFGCAAFVVAAAMLFGVWHIGNQNGTETPAASACRACEQLEERARKRDRGLPSEKEIEFDPSLATVECDRRGHRRRTPLSVAAIREDYEALKYLLNDRDSANHQNEGQTVMMYLAYGWFDTSTERERCGELLLSHGADINAAGARGLTPLHIAVSYGHLPAVSWLVEHGANLNARDGDGMTPLHLAAQEKESKSIEIVAKLLQLGADRRAEDNHRRTPKALANTDQKRDLLDVEPKSLP